MESAVVGTLAAGAMVTVLEEGTSIQGDARCRIAGTASTPEGWLSAKLLAMPVAPETPSPTASAAPAAPTTTAIATAKLLPLSADERKRLRKILAFYVRQRPGKDAIDGGDVAVGASKLLIELGATKFFARVDGREIFVGSVDGGLTGAQLSADALDAAAPALAEADIEAGGYLPLLAPLEASAAAAAATAVPPLRLFTPEVSRESGVIMAWGDI